MNTKLNLKEIRTLKELTYSKYSENTLTNHSYYELYYKLIDLEVEVLNAKATRNAKKEYEKLTRNNPLFFTRKR
jgi:hypothetical protein